MKNKNILISGAGVAGLTLAFWLKRFGFNPTLVEKHPTLRLGGYKIDIRGVALEILKRMEIYSLVAEHRTAISHAVFVDKAGKQVSQVSADFCGTRMEGVDLEIMRGNLCLIMKDALGEVECLFDDTVTHIAQGINGVTVRFEKHTPRLFDLVIGTDGLHSTIRKLTFGDEFIFSREFGVYLSVFSIPNFLNLDACEIEHHSFRKFVNLYRDGNDINAKVAMAFSIDKPFYSRDQNEQKKLIEEIFANSDWEMSRILEAMKDSSDFYFDSMAQIHMPLWSKDRVTLVGDAAYSATPMSGQGTSIAIAGAYVLAGELSDAEGDYQVAFSNYEKLIRPFVEKNQALAHVSARIMKGSFYSVWLHKIASIMPAKVLHYFKNLALNRTTKAANALILKEYNEKNN
ncbi:6-hydroxynicotinate 3-monooxygenase precursor [Candidatus Rubidus massiliensis]|nr:6-hydroxynicotinate 3-monooxygenase precursor [Candidatus Rubidus massiliensis]